MTIKKIFTKDQATTVFFEYCCKKIALQSVEDIWTKIIFVIMMISHHENHFCDFCDRIQVPRTYILLYQKYFIDINATS